MLNHPKTSLHFAASRGDISDYDCPAAALYQLAYSQYTLGGYNINNLEQILGLFKGCIDSQAPFILQISKGARSYADKRMLEAITPGRA
jgi:fructose/tagatose bisphosphate aldolase